MPLGRVCAHGRVDDARRDALIRRADVLCAPAMRGESLGLVVAEAMAAGVPVVAARVGGVPELLGERAGLLVPPGDATALAGARDELLASPARRARAGRAGRARARALDGSLLADRVLEVYARALGVGAVDMVPRPAGRPRLTWPASDVWEVPDGSRRVQGARRASLR